MADTRYDAFISYRRENGFLMAQVIYDRLKDRGIQCFFDLEELRSGKFDEKILVAIREAHTFILILPKNALTRCKNEDDWVRQEILEAVRCNKVIIPVMYDGFKWPRKWSAEFPEEFHGLEHMNGVSGAKEYLSAMIDKIISYMPKEQIHLKFDEDRTNPLERKQKTIDTATFFTDGLNRVTDVQRIDMFFRGGSEWHLNSNVVELLSRILDKGIKMRVIVNEKETVEETAKHMRHNLRKYYGYDQNASNWVELSKKYPELVSVRIADVPLMRRYHNIIGEENGVMKVSYYTYGNPYPDKDCQNIIESSDKVYKLYSDEFEYLWNRGSHEV